MTMKAAELPTTPKELVDQFVPGPRSVGAFQAAPRAFKEALI